MHIQIFKHIESFSHLYLVQTIFYVYIFNLTLIYLLMYSILKRNVFQQEAHSMGVNSKGREVSFFYVLFFAVSIHMRNTFTYNSFNKSTFTSEYHQLSQCIISSTFTMNMIINFHSEYDQLSLLNMNLSLSEI